MPSILITILSWVSFWINYDASAARVALGKEADKGAGIWLLSDVDRDQSGPANLPAGFPKIAMCCHEHRERLNLVLLRASGTALENRCTKLKWIWSSFPFFSGGEGKGKWALFCMDIEAILIKFTLNRLNIVAEILHLLFREANA